MILIIPDGTRTAPNGLMFKALHAHLASAVNKFDVLVALGTHPAMTDDAINARVWSGIHFRTADVVAAQMGTQISNWALDHYFKPTRHDDD